MLKINVINLIFRYCSNFYGELAEIEQCDWCQSEGKNNPSRHIIINGSNSKKPVVAVATNRSEYSGEKIIKQHDRDQENINGSEKAVKSPTPSPRPAARRYKLLKDVMC